MHSEHMKDPDGETFTRIVKLFAQTGNWDPHAIEALLEETLRLPAPWQGFVVGHGSIRNCLGENVPKLTERSLEISEALYMSDGRWSQRSLSESLVRGASLASASGTGTNSNSLRSTVSLIERLNRPSDLEADGRGDVTGALRELCHRLLPAFSLPICKQLHPQGVAVSTFIRRANSLTVDEIKELASWDAPAVDAALGMRADLPPRLREILFIRHESGPRVLGYVATRSTPLVLQLLERKDTAPLRHLARNMHLVDHSLHVAVSRRVLTAILLEPQDGDEAAVPHITAALGPAAATAFIETGYDFLAAAVAESWRWTTNDGVFVALARYRREYVRARMIPSVAVDDSIDVTDEEESRLRAVVLPQLLTDRSNLVRGRAHEFLRALDERERTPALPPVDWWGFPEDPTDDLLLD